MMDPASRRFDLLIFDWDGTLVNSIDWIVTCLQQAAEETGFPVPSNQVARSVIGLSLDGALRRVFPGIDPSALKPMVDRYREHFFSRDLTDEDLFEGVEATLRSLAGRGYRMAVATGKARRGLDKAMCDTGLARFFETTRCADETESKPHPAMLIEILQQTGAPVDRAVMIGDSVHDLAMASAAGMRAIAVTSGANTWDELNELSPMVCVAGVAQLPDHL